MDEMDLSQVSAKEFLRDGLTGSDGRPREGLNGVFSLGMAHRLKQEDFDPDVLKDLARYVRRVAEDSLDLGDAEALGRPLREDVLFALAALAEMDDVAASPALGELIEAALPQLRTGRELQAFAGHLDRVLAQLALIGMLQEASAPDKG
jgi:hypothetical protein